MASELMASTAARPVYLSQLGGLPPRRNVITAVSAGAPQKESDANQYRTMAQLGNLSPSLAAILRPQAAYRWLLPYVASLTPQYIESVLRGALAGNHVQAWELFDLMMDTDPEIAACVQEYVEGIQRKKVKFIPYADEGEEPSDSALEKCKLVSAAFRNMRPETKYDESGFGEMVKDIIAARWHGQSIIEMDWMDTYKDGSPFLRDTPGFNNPVLCPRASFWVHPVCYAWDMSGRLGLRVAVESQLSSLKKAAGYSPANRDYSLVEPPAWNWIASQPRPSALMDFPANKFLISIFKAKTGSALAGSCLRPLAWWWIASNFCGDWLMNYAQVFGIPLRVASMAPGTSQATWDDVRAIMRAAGSAPYLVLPQGADIKVVEKGGQAGESPQAFLFHFADDQKRKVILHQTMTGGSHSGGSSGTGKSFGATEQDTKQCCIDAGASHVETVLNLQAIPYILNLNYGEGGDLEAPTVSLVDAKVGGLADAQRDQILVQVMDIGENYMHEKYGIPKPSDNEELAGQDIGSNANAAKLQQQQQSAQNDHDETMAELNAPELGDEPEEGAGSSQPPKGEPTQARRALQAGDQPGHDFHGNQWTQMSGAARGAFNRAKSKILEKDSEGKMYASLEKAQDASDSAKTRSASRTHFDDYEGGGEYASANYHRSRAAISGDYFDKEQSIKDAIGHAKDAGVNYGWANEGGRVPHVVYFDTKEGQVSFHSPSRGEGPDYNGPVHPAETEHHVSSYVPTGTPEEISKNLEESKQANRAFFKQRPDLEKSTPMKVAEFTQLREKLTSPEDIAAHERSVGAITKWQDSKNNRQFKTEVFHDEPSAQRALAIAKEQDPTASVTKIEHPATQWDRTHESANRISQGIVRKMKEHGYVPKPITAKPETLSARFAIDASDESIPIISPDTKSADTALLESIQPMLDRLEAIKAVKDSSTRRRLLSKFLRDHESITAAILHDQALSRVVTPDVVKKFVAGLKSKGEKA